jgi:hypothetical protein
MHDPTAAVLRKDVYNRRAKLTKRSLGGMSLIQALLFHFEENKGFICYYHVDEENRLDRLLWIHRDMLELLKLNSEVLIMDITFKTNRFQMKLFNIVGITLFNIIFYLAFVFLTHKAAPDFEWVFTHLKLVYDQLEIRHPQTLVTDQEPGLLPALQSVFPEASQLLCTWHIDKDVEVYVRKTFTEYYKRDRETPIDEVVYVVKTKFAEFMAHWKTVRGCVDSVR